MQIFFAHSCLPLRLLQVAFDSNFTMLLHHRLPPWQRTGCLPLHAAGGSSPFGGFRCATICNELRATKALLRSPPMLKRPFHYNFHASQQTENYPHVYTLLPLRLQISTSSTFQAVLLVHRTLCSVKTSSSQQFPMCVFCGFRPTCSSHMFTSPKY